MSELRYAVAFWDERTGKVSWQQLSQTDPLAPADVEHDGTDYVAVNARLERVQQLTAEAAGVPVPAVAVVRFSTR